MNDVEVAGNGGVRTEEDFNQFHFHMACLVHSPWKCPNSSLPLGALGEGKGEGRRADPLPKFGLLPDCGGLDVIQLREAFREVRIPFGLDLALVGASAAGGAFTISAVELVDDVHS